MSCTGCSNHTTASNASDAAFEHVWPVGLPGPRLLPWLGAAASRDDARAWALAIGADRDPGVLAGDEQAMLHLIGRTMGGGGVYAQERKGRKKERSRRGRPSADVVCFEYARVACRDAGGVMWSEVKDGLCSWRCLDGGVGGPFDDTEMPWDP